MLRKLSTGTRSLDAIRERFCRPRIASGYKKCRSLGLSERHWACGKRQVIGVETLAHVIAGLMRRQPLQVVHHIRRTGQTQAFSQGCGFG